MDDKGASYELRIEGAGLALTRTIDEAVARSVLNLVLGGHAAPPLVEEPANHGRSGRPESKDAAPTHASARTSLREHLTETGAKRYPDKILVIGDYLERHEDTQGFTRDDIKSRFRAAGEAPPANFGRDFAWAVSNGWIAEDPKERGQFYVTRTGRAAIESGFSADVMKGSKQKSGRRRRGGRSDDGVNE